MAAALGRYEGNTGKRQEPSLEAMAVDPHERCRWLCEREMLMAQTRVEAGLMVRRSRF